MTKKAIIFHGTDGNPNNAWYQWLGTQLKARGYIVEVPHFPTLNKEPIATFLPKVFAAHTFEENTVIVGHSGGAALLLSILEQVDVTLPQAFLVAGYMTPPNTNDEPVLQHSYDWKKIKRHVHDIYFINSTDDPYGCDDKQGSMMFKRIGGTQIIRNEGHFGSPEQNYPTFTLLDKLIN